MLYRIKYTSTCVEMLRQIQQPQRGMILNRIGQLEKDPEKQGKPLIGPLAGYRSLHVSRYRVVFRAIRDQVEVFILVAGLRREGAKDDVYELAKRLVRNFLVP